jgi:hypothetical protein
MTQHKLALTLLLAGAFHAQATLITSVPAGATTTVFAGGVGCGGATDAGFVISGGACWNYSQYYGFGTNGAWNNPPAGFGLIGDNTATSSFLINLGGLYSSVGGFINYDPPTSGGGPDSSPHADSSPLIDPNITALAANGTTVLDTYDIAELAPISTPGGVNAGAFVGIQDATNDIAYLELSNDFIAIHSITVATADSITAPEPPIALLAISGLGLLCVSVTRLFRECTGQG